MSHICDCCGERCWDAGSWPIAAYFIRSNNYTNVICSDCASDFEVNVYGQLISDHEVWAEDGEWSMNNLYERDWC